MSNCEKIQGCLFFNDKFERMPLVSDSLKEAYCKDDYHDCARYLVCEALGADKVPKDLYPNQVNRARTLIEQSSNNVRVH